MRMFRCLSVTVRSTVLAIAASSAMLVEPGHAASGDLDTSFDGDGRAVVDLGGIDSVNAAVEQPDGKIVVAGASDGDFALARFQTNGRLDTSFGTGGITTTNFSVSTDVAEALAIADDGRIFAAGSSGGPSTTHKFAVARYAANGTLEGTFEGTFDTVEGATASGHAIALAPDGGIFVAGSNDSGDWGIAKLTTALALDTSFSGDGKRTLFLGGDSVATALAALGDGGLIVVGSAGGDFAIEKFNAVGNRLNDFGGVTNLGEDHTDVPRALAVQDDGKIVVVGQSSARCCCGPCRPTMAVARYEGGDGTLDETFSSGGFRFIAATVDSDARAVAVQLDGKIVVGGFLLIPDRAIAIARLHTTGDLDTTFSGDGLLTTSLSGTDATANALVLRRNNGRIVTAGSLITRNADGDVVNSDAVLTRYHAISCNNRDVTRIGTNGPDTIFGAIILSAPVSGSPVADVLHAFGGDDTINAGGNNDTVCGGTGRDTVNGGTGNDTLLGQGGSDSLDGADGDDTCSGGGFVFPADTFQNCETVNAGRSGFSGEWLDVSQHCNRSGENPQCRLIGILEVENPGTETTAVPAIAAVYLSFDDQLDEGDVFLTNIDIPVLEPGETHVLRLNLKVSDFDDLSDLQVIAVLDAGDVVPEVNEENNTVVSEPLR